MIRRSLFKRTVCTLVVGLSLCTCTFGNSHTVKVYAKEDVDIGTATTMDYVADDFADNYARAASCENGEFEEETDVVEASYTSYTAYYDFDTSYQILDLINQARATKGLPSLTMDKDLLDASMFRAVEIGECFNHVRPNGQTWDTISSKAWGENIAYGYSSAQSVTNAWLNSPGHYANIMGDYTSVGVGAVIVDGKRCYTQLFGIGDVVPVASKPSNQTVTVNVPKSADAATIFPTVVGSAIELEYNDDTIFPSTDIKVSYITHIQSYGWQGNENDSTSWRSDGKIGGSLGLSKRLEGIKLVVSGDANLGIKYRTHIQSYGWEKAWKSDGQMSGTSGESKRLEAIEIQLTGADKNSYDVYYRVHAQSYGWLGWAKNGQSAGTAGQGKRLEAIQVVVVPKGTAPSGTIGYSYIEVGKSAKNTSTSGAINYMTHVQSYGDQSYVHDGSVSGTFGESKRLEAIRINLNNGQLGYQGGVRYTTHVQSYGWQGQLDNPKTWKKDGAVAGTSGEGKRLEAICIELYGEVSQHYDVFYRVHAQSFGWLGWTKNGAPSGTAGYAKRLEGIQVVILPKGSAPPSSNPGTSGTQAYISK